MKNIVKLLLILFIIVSADILFAGSIDPIKAESIVARNLNGKIEKVDFTDGKISVINFFSIKCRPCRKELPEIAKIEKIYPEINFYAVHLGLVKEEKIKIFLSKLPAHPENILIAGDILKEKYKIFGLPFTAIINSEGFITHRLQGYVKPEKLKKILSGI